MSTPQYDYEEIRRPHDGSHSPRRWSAKHDLIHNLVPFKHYAVNPWEQLTQLRDYLVSLPDHASTWRWREVPELSSKLNHSGRITTLTDVLGAWPIRKQATGGTLWANPWYPQLDQVEWTPDEEQALHWFRTALLGKWTMRELAHRYNVNDKVLYTVFNHRDMTFGDVQAYGRRRLANTVVVATEWTDLSIRAAGRVLDVPNGTLNRWINRHATLDPVPRRPSECGIGSGW